MTISSTASEISYAGNGATVAFAIPFPFDTSADIKVTSTVTATGDVSVLSSGFSITGGGGSTGTITFTIAPASTVSITLIDDPARTQPTDYVANDAFPAESHERALDRVTRLCKRLYQRSLRSLRVPDGDPVTDAELAPVSTRKGKYLFFDAITGAIDYATAIATTTLSQGTIGALLYPRTAAEIAAGVTPTDYVQTFDVARMGVVGDGATDNTSDIQDILNAARYGRSRVHFPSQNLNGQTVYVTGKLAVYEGTHVTADPGVLIRSNITTSTDHVFECISTLGTATALTANASKRGNTVAVTSASGLSAGMLVEIRDNTYKWSTNGRNLELNEIESIASLTVTLKNRLIGDYTTAQSAELVPVTTPARGITFENVTVEIPSGKDGGAFYFEDAYNCNVVNCGSSGQKGQTGLTAWRSAYIKVRGGVYADGQSQSTPGYGYGITFSQSSHHCVAHDVTFRNVRECSVSLGARFCGYVNCESHSSYDNAFNAHADGSEDCFFINCRSYYSRSKGFYAGGVTAQAPDKRIRFINCESHYAGYLGFWADGASGVESEDIEFIDCVDFHSGDDTGTSFGFYAFRSLRPRIINCRSDADGETNYRSNIKAEICTDAEIRGNKVRGQSGGWGIIHANCTGVRVDDNTITGIGSNQGVHAESTASTKVLVRGNSVDNDVIFTKNAGDTHELNEYSTKRQCASGSATVADGGTITHGLVSTPITVRVQCSVSGEFASVTAVGGTTITLAIKKHDNTAGTSQTIYWEAAA